MKLIETWLAIVHITESSRELGFFSVFERFTMKVCLVVLREMVTTSLNPQESIGHVPGVRQLP